METLNYEKKFDSDVVTEKNEKAIKRAIDLIQSSIDEMKGNDHDQRIILDFALISINGEVTVYKIKSEIETKVYNCELPY